MKEQFVPYEIAKQLKEKGFTEPCFGIYDKNGYLYTKGSIYSYLDDETNIIAPLWQQVIDWFRDKHSIMICIDFYDEGSEKEPHIIYHFKISEPKTWYKCDIIVKSDYKTYPEARQAAIEHALTLI